MTQTEALRLALEALELCTNQGMIPMYLNKNKDAITAIKVALEAKDEPVAVAWANRDGTKFVGNGRKWIHQDCVIPLYTHPPQRKPLMDEEIEKLAEQVGMLIDKYGLALDAENGLDEGVDAFGFARAIEAAHGIKGEA